LPPGRVAFERKRNRRLCQSIDRDFHVLHRSQPAPVRAPLRGGPRASPTG
jgi:hypothetical protein